MENQDNLFNQIKAAADNAEPKSFPGMENVWHRVEEKMDQRVLKKENKLWKKIAVAASLLLIGTLGYQWFNTPNPIPQSNETVTQSDSIPQNATSKEAVVESNNQHPAMKAEADQILEKQIVARVAVAVEEVREDDVAKSVSGNQGYFTAPTVAQPAAVGSYSAAALEHLETKSKDVELYMSKENRVSNAKKEAPLIVYDNKITKKQSLDSVNPADIESLTILKEPLYIINGIYYTEQEVFGPNPTSPYSPLSEQHIVTISVLQDEEAVELYGEKGKKGVVIIATKDGKPAEKKGKKNPIQQSQTEKK